MRLQSLGWELLKVFGCICLSACLLYPPFIVLHAPTAILVALLLGKGFFQSAAIVVLIDGLLLYAIWELWLRKLLGFYSAS